MRRTAFRTWRLEGSSVVPCRGGVPLSDRGFRYGEHFFESLAVRDGEVLLIGEHLANLSEAACASGWPFPKTIRTPLRSFCTSARLPDGMLRIYLTAGAGAPGAPVTKPECFLTWEATRFPSEADLSKGITLVTLKHPVAGDGWGVKSGNYLQHLEALRAARAAGAEEGIILDEKGRVVSSAMGNLLVWLPSRRGPLLCTPSWGARSGAVLGWVRQHAGVTDRLLRLSDICRAVALAVTNSRLGVMPVASLDGKALTNPSPARSLAFAYLRSHGLLRGT
jgi:branched-subunit amino acid aminotransferase/4-amino-4-deoxychorismate lyase